jgi:hypothetical protein
LVCSDHSRDASEVSVDADIYQAGGGEDFGDVGCLGVTAFDGEEAAGAETV